MGNVVPLSNILGVGELMVPAVDPTGCASSACGSSDGPDGMPDAVWNKVKDHPCYSEEAHHYYARMHVAVAPACNIQCNYCNRKYDCANESRPGVVSERLSPDQAALKVAAVAAEMPQLAVVGIAGAGDALANPERTFRTFELIRKQTPDIKLCLSTNGLALPDHVDRLKELDIDHLTITINMVDPEIGVQIYPWIFYNHRRWHGLEASTLLHQRQMEGLEKAVAAGILVKVNSVMIPGINDHHLAEVNRRVREAGAFLHNIMPLISDPAHGTHFGLTGQRGPSPAELKALQDHCEGEIKVMRHCRQCRADAIGMLGDDQGAKFGNDAVAAMAPPDAAAAEAARQAYRQHIEAERLERRRNRAQVRARIVGAAPRTRPAEPPVLVAVATSGGERINVHFGHAKEFQVFEVGAKGARFVGHRRVETYCEGGSGDGGVLDGIVTAIGDCAAVMVAKIGDCPSQTLRDKGIEPIDRFAFGYIEESLLTFFAERRAATLTPVRVA
ncbi:MAG: nitrogenase cofactor biosynthesis protein NifB [Azospirillum sp.]|nr:nitrogenase cofactor biosynthesis protein NifB [Azospirillum sp.]